MVNLKDFEFLEICAIELNESTFSTKTLYYKNLEQN